MYVVCAIVTHVGLVMHVQTEMLSSVVTEGQSATKKREWWAWCIGSACA